MARAVGLDGVGLLFSKIEVRDEERPIEAEVVETEPVSVPVADES